MDGFCTITVAYELLCNTLGFTTSSTEDDTIHLWVKVQNTARSLVSVLWANHVKLVLYFRCTDVLLTGRNLFRIVQILLRQFLHAVWHGRTETKCLLFFWSIGEN